MQSSRIRKKKKETERQIDRGREGAPSVSRLAECKASKLLSFCEGREEKLLLRFRCVFRHWTAVERLESRHEDTEEHAT